MWFAVLIICVNNTCYVHAGPTGMPAMHFPSPDACAEFAAAVLDAVAVNAPPEAQYQVTCMPFGETV